MDHIWSIILGGCGGQNDVFSISLSSDCTVGGQRPEMNLNFPLQRVMITVLDRKLVGRGASQGDMIVGGVNTKLKALISVSVLVLLI